MSKKTERWKHAVEQERRRRSAFERVLEIIGELDFAEASAVVTEIEDLILEAGRDAGDQPKTSDRIGLDMDRPPSTWANGTADLSTKVDRDTLDFVCRKEPVSNRDVGAWAGITPQNAQHRLKRLVRAGYVVLVSEATKGSGAKPALWGATAKGNASQLSHVSQSDPPFGSGGM